MAVVRQNLTVRRSWQENRDCRMTAHRILAEQKRLPAPCRLRAAWCLLCPARNSQLGGREAEHFEFTVDARSTPSGILCEHLENEVAFCRLIRFLPSRVLRRESQAQYRRKPERCHRTTVLGVTTALFRFEDRQLVGAEPSFPASSRGGSTTGGRTTL